MHQQKCEITAKSDKHECCTHVFTCVHVRVKLRHVLRCDTYTRRLVLGEHTPGVIVEVVFIGGMLCLSKAIDKLR